MSECVVRMEPPKGCWCCPFGHYDWIWGDDGREKMVCFCCLDVESEEDGHYLLETELKRPSWCPIICSLPAGHGRLVDADGVFLAMVERGQKSSRYKLGEMWELNGLEIQEALQTVSTIVPAERSET